MSPSLLVDNSPSSLAVQLVLAVSLPPNHALFKTERASSPNAKVPCLEHEWGNFSGSFTILQFFNETKPLIGDDIGQAQNLQWVRFCETELDPAKIKQLTVSSPRLVSIFRALDSQLSLNSYFSEGFNMSIADVFLFAYLHNFMSQVSQSWKLDHINLCRWFDQMQHQLAEFVNAKSIVPRMVDFVVDLPLKFAPLQKEDKKKKKKETQDANAANPPIAAPATTAAAAATTTTAPPAPTAGPTAAPVAEQPVVTDSAAAVQKEDKKKKKEPQQKPAQQQPPKKKDATDISILDIRVGKIMSVRKHENADSLYVEDIDVGEEKPRVVCSGLVNFIPIDRMQNRVVLVCCNLKETNMRGIVSQAMVMAASNDDHTVVDLVNVPDGAKIGEPVQFAGYEGVKGTNLTRKQLELVLPDLKTTAEGLCVYKDAAFMTSVGPCTSGLLNAHIA